MEESGETVVIHFSEQGLVLKLGEQVVYEKSRQSLLRLKQRLDWVEQLDKELVRKQLILKQ